MQLYQHQQQVVAEKDRPDRLRFGNWRGTGSGKTRTTVAIAEGITLVICPKTQADEGIWQTEWLFQGRNAADLFVLSKEQFKKAFKADPLSICGGRYPNTLIIDEAHTVAGVQPSERQKSYIKFPRTSQIFDTVIGYINLAQPKRIHPLTATPAPNPMALFSLGIILGRQWDYHQFRQTFYIEKEVRGRKLWLVNRSKENKALLQRTLELTGYRGTLQDWFDVPDQTFKVHEVGTTTEQESYYQELKTLYPDPLVQTGKRQKLEQGLFDETTVDPDTKEVLTKTTHIKETKAEAIDGYMQQFGKVIVFCRYTEQIELYKKAFAGKYKVLTLTGATKRRGELLEEARAAEECLFLVQCQISAGWELPDFPCMIFASLDYSFVNYDQAIGRILRSNALKKNLYVFLIAGDGDAKVHKVVHEKEDFVSEKQFARKYGKQLCEKKKLKSPRE